MPAPTITFTTNGVLPDGKGNINANLTERINLRQQTQPILNSDGLYSVTRTLEMLYPIGQDTGNYICIASVSIAELSQALRDEDTFNVIVQSKCPLITPILMHILILPVYIYKQLHQLLKSPQQMH